MFLIACLLAIAGSAMADATLDEFVIGIWGGPSDDATAEALVDANFNTVRATEDQLELCRKHGLKVVLQNATPEDAARLKDDEAVWGYWVHDEPKAEQFAEVSERVAAFHEADPEKIAYVNLMAWMDLSDYLGTVKPRLLSYDYYQWWWGAQNHFWRLEAHRRAALDAGLPLVCWVEGTSDKRWEWGEKGQTYLFDNMPKIRQSIYTGLAYGVKGFFWFNDYVLFEHATGRKMLPELRRAGEDARQLNSELAVLGPVMVKLGSVDVFHSPPLPKETRPIPPDCWVKTRNEGITLGLLTDADGGEYVMVVNRDVTGGEWASLEFAPNAEAVWKLDAKSGRWLPVPLQKDGQQRRAQLILRAGDGALLRVEFAGGEPGLLSVGSSVRGKAWSADGTV